MANDSSTEEVTTRIPVQVLQTVEALAALKGVYGANKSAVLRYFIVEGVKEALRDEVFTKHRTQQEEIERLLSARSGAG